VIKGGKSKRGETKVGYEDITFSMEKKNQPPMGRLVFKRAKLPSFADD